MPDLFHRRIHDENSPKQNDQTVDVKVAFHPAVDVNTKNRVLEIVNYGYEKEKERNAQENGNANP